MSVKGFLHMMRQALRSPSAWAVSIALALLLVYGCGVLDNKGSAGDNSRPEVFIVGIPADGSEFAVSPTVYWYGTDSDGQISRYDYAVVTAAEVDSVVESLDLPPSGQSAVEQYIAFVLNDQFPRWVSIFVDSDSLDIGELPTQQDVRLFASPFPADCDTNYIAIRDDRGNATGETLLVPIDCVSDTIPQYFFVRAFDDQNKSSQIKYRSYKRRNHWPETVIARRFDQNVEYISLRNPTATYQGIQMTWGGSDRLDFVAPALPFLEYHWRLYGPYPIDPNNPTVRPTLADTMIDETHKRQPVFESANPDPLIGVWVRDTTEMLFDLWSQADRDPDALNDTTVSRSAWFMFVVTARDDAYIADETPAVATFKTHSPKFERKLVYVDDGWYLEGAWGMPAPNPRKRGEITNQTFYWNLVKMVYPEADTLQDFWWRSRAVPYDVDCPTRTSCGNYLSLELLIKHQMCLITDDDIIDNISLPGESPNIQGTLRRYLDAGGMVWIIGRGSLEPNAYTCFDCKERMFDFCDEDGIGFSRLACEYFDLEGMWYPGYRTNALPIRETEELARTPSSNDEFIGATLVSPGSGLPAALEIDRARVDSMYMPAHVVQILKDNGTPRIVGIPDVDFIVLGANSEPLYIFESWRPGGPIPPYGIQSFMHQKPVAVRRVGPDRATPLYKTAYMAFPLYFIKQEQSEEMFRKMYDWFFLPFGQS